MSYITFKSKLIEQKVKQYLKKKHADLLVKEGRRVLVKEEGFALGGLSRLANVPQYKGIRVAIGEYNSLGSLATFGKATKTLFEYQGNGLYASR